VREVFAGLFISRPVLPALAAALVGMTLLPLKILLGGWLVACISAASSALLVYLGLSAFVRVRRYTTKRFPNHLLVPRLWLAWLAIAFVDATITRLFPAFAVVPEANVLLIMAFDVFVFSFVALSGSIASQRNSTLRQLADAVERNSWAIARLSQMAWAQQRHLAQLVHGDVQSRITAVALSLRYHKASDEEAAQKIAELVAYCKSVLSGNSNPETIDEFLAGAKELWQGTLKISVNESESALTSLRKDETSNMVAVEIIREAISNAVRHGQAKNIDISMILNGPQAKTMTIRIDNDGVSETADLTPGFGSKLLDQLTTSWSLKRGPKGIRLEAQIPLD
jgi:signal transduction histidine kinase